MIGCHLLTHCHFNDVEALISTISVLITSIILLLLMNLQRRNSETCFPLHFTCMQAVRALCRIRTWFLEIKYSITHLLMN